MRGALCRHATVLRCRGRSAAPTAAAAAAAPMRQSSGAAAPSSQKAQDSADSGSHMPTSEQQSEMDFDILAVMAKSNARWSKQQQPAATADVGGAEEEEEDEKKHLAPQHRRFLSHAEIGPGTPHNREKRASRLRLALAVSRSHDYQLDREGLVSEEAGANRLTQAKGLDAIVEDKIQMAIMRGDFDALRGRGQPLETEREGSVVDPATDVISRLLAQNGILPGWVEKQKAVNALGAALRARVRGDWAAAYLDANRGGGGGGAPHAPSPGGTRSGGGGSDSGGGGGAPAWVHPDAAAFRRRAEGAADHADVLRELNAAIDAYNLEVPSYHLQRGRARIAWLLEAVTAAPIRGRAEAAALAEEGRRARQQALSFETLLLDPPSYNTPPAHSHAAMRSTGGGGRAWAADTGYGAGMHGGGGAGAARGSNALLQVCMLPIDGLADMLRRAFF
ncbi:hypothetical protein JKP88DRAFT_350648 [Tribonema minus]|uniref:DnaJ homologue subfamily C member 28 conserved domain-containing protein n=1 Tax=Tribonema minus TaxID=303371 RepID=A0A836CA93_9STRA|nr:hypothetical protein JKP88DRAFT_350648 [Tribonema minus]